MAQNYFKLNYRDVVEFLTPGVYLEDDLVLSGLQDSVVDSVINSHLEYMSQESDFLNISATTNFSDIHQVSGIGRFFVSQNKLTKITPDKLELEILVPLGYSLNDYTSESSFRTFLSGTLLPKIILNNPNLAATTDNAFSTDSSGVHEYLLNSMGWAYALNTSAPPAYFGHAAGTFDPSSWLVSSLTTKVFNGETFTTKDGIVGLTHYLWRNWENISGINSNVIPSMFLSGTDTFTSGTQNLDKLETLINIIYTDQDYASEDLYVKNAIEDYALNNNILEGEEPAGPFRKFLQGISYSLFDTMNQVEGLSNLYDIEKCPDKLLPYMADLIGWSLYGSNTDSWRRQLRSATTLYKQKGTKEGLYNALTTVLPNTSIQMSSISEFYESYVPNLIYYLLKTDTTLFDTFESWTQERAEGYTDGEYSYTDMDLNIRYVIDHLILKAVLEFPELFYVKNFKFDVNNPEFTFYYRNRAFCIPPWEEEKFYRFCDITEQLILFIKNELICLGVSTDMANEFATYVLNNTTNGNKDARFYNNSFLFLTSSLEQPPNRTTILENYDFDSYQYLPIWNGKSSFFDLEVSSGQFTDAFFSTGDFRKEDLFQSLRVVDEFSPAKAIPRTRVDLNQTEDLSSLDWTCPSVRYWFFDIPLSGFHAGFESSSMDMRGITGFVGSDYSVTEDLTKSNNDHTNLPVFKRNLADDSQDKVFMIGNTVATTQQTLVDRTSTRRRNHEISLQKGGLYIRNGLDMPSYFNPSALGSQVEYWPLGYLPAERCYHPVVNPLDLTEVSSTPYNLDIWTVCWDLSSSKAFSDIDSSSTFDIRGNTSIEMSTCNAYVARDRTPEFYSQLWNIQNNKYIREAEEIIAINGFLMDVSGFMDKKSTLVSWLWNTDELTFDEIYNTVVGKRFRSKDSLDGIHKTFKDYIDHFTTQGLGSSQITTRLEGGLNILSHMFGPINYNGYFAVEGSGLDTSSSLLANSVGSELPFTLPEVSGLNNLSITDSADLPVGGSEVRNPYILSGVELADVSGSTSQFSLLNIDSDNSIEGIDNFLVGNTTVIVDPLKGFPRLRFSIKDYGPGTNLLIPERDFELDIQALIASKDNKILGGGSIGVWIHTDVETDYYGNKVFWNYMPDGTWRMLPVNPVTRSTGVDYVRNNLSHTLDFSETYKLSSRKECYAGSVGKEVLFSIQEKDFRNASIKFDTRNNKIKVGLPYFQAHQQVHRQNQNYIIEVFPVNTQTPDKFALFNYISLVDHRQKSRAAIKHSFDIKDYRLNKNPIEAACIFVDSSGNQIPYNTDLFLDSSGNITTSSGDSVTFVKSESGEGVLSNNVLYKTVNAYIKKTYHYDASGSTVVESSKRLFDGMFQQNSDGTYEPGTLIVEGLVRGSNIVLSFENVEIPLSEQEVLILLREFNRLQKDVGSREASISASRYGPQGGSRLNYRDAPMWYNTGGHTQFVSDDNQYTELRFTN